MDSSAVHNAVSLTHFLVRAHALKAPNAVALICGGVTMNYSEMEHQSSCLSEYLKSKKISGGDIVAVALKPSFNLVIAILAIWKAGAAYLPLEPTYPIERLIAMLGDADAALVLTDSAMCDVFLKFAIKNINLDSDREWKSQSPVSEDFKANLGALAYLMYTSGSTGKPKGVMVPHSALVNKIIYPGTWGYVSNECCAVLLTSIAFDASLAQIFLALGNGGRVLLIDEQDRCEPTRLWALVKAAGVNFLDCTPSWLTAMLDAAPKDLRIKRLVLGGEILTPNLVRRVRIKFPMAIISNVYGPTETCIDALAHEVCPADMESDRIPIGVPLPGYYAYLLDSQLQAVATDSIGEIYIGGVGLASGYWRNDEANAERFIADPFNFVHRLYRTGDLGRYRQNGCIEFLGRADHQIKLRGQRLELGELESVLSGLPEVLAAVVKVWRKPSSDDVMLTAYVVPRDDDVTSQVLFTSLRRKLPDFMVPTEIILMKQLPLLANGKVNREALPEMSVQKDRLSRKDLPRDDTELTLLQIWQETLLRDDIGIYDNFFSLGGDSLSVIRLLIIVNERFHAQLPLTTLLGHPAIADLALTLQRHIRSGCDNKQPVRALLLSKQPAGKPVLFLLPPITGVGLIYVGLARALDELVSTIALQAIDLRSTPGQVTMQQIAGVFIDEIERIQPTGHLLLGGYSAGGVIAHELIRQLKRVGRTVSHLFLFDPYSAKMSNSVIGAQSTDDPNAFWGACGDMIWDALGIRGSAADPLINVSAKIWSCVQVEGCWDKHSPQLKALAHEIKAALPPHVGIEVFFLLFEGLVNLWHAFTNHQMIPLSTFTSQMLIIQPDGEEGSQFRDARNAEWQKLFGAEMQTEMVSGLHATMLSQAQTVNAIAALVRQKLGHAASTCELPPRPIAASQGPSIN